MNFRSGDNPAAWNGALSHLLPATSKAQTVTHHKAVPYDEVSALMSELRQNDSISAKALMFTILTAARTSETTGAKWDEIDLHAKVWTVPAERMKAGREHRVPLSDAAVKLLKSIPREGRFVFESPTHRRPLSNMAMLMLLRGIRGDGSTVHGFRSSFRDWAADKTDVPREVVEACIAHAICDESELSYKRTDFLEKRRAVMGLWAEHCGKGRCPVRTKSGFRQGTEWPSRSHKSGRQREGRQLFG